MDDAQRKLDRRNFLQTSAALAASAAIPPSTAVSSYAATESLASQTANPFLVRQKERRTELWKLLGDLPWEPKPGPARLVKKEEHEDYTLERLILDLNGFEPVPALLLIPRKRQTPARDFYTSTGMAECTTSASRCCSRAWTSHPPTRQCASRRAS